MRLARVVLLVFVGALLGGFAGAAGAVELVVLAAGAAASNFVAAAVGGGIFGALAGAAASFAVSGILGGLLGKENKSPQDTGAAGSFAAEARGRLQVLRSAVASRELVYGTVMKSGPLIYGEVNGGGNGYVHLVIALANHEIAGVDAVYFNDQLVGTRDADGNVTDGQFAGEARVTIHTGAVGDAADADLKFWSAGLWTDAHTLTGVAYAVVRLHWDSDVYPSGIPNVKFLVRGKKLYDPRTGLTAFSNNWALVVRDYLTTPAVEGGFGADQDEIDDTYAVAAANVCDEAVAQAAYLAVASGSASTNTLNFGISETTLATGDGVTVSATALPAPLVAGTLYYCIRLDAARGQLATSHANALNGVAIDLTTDGTGFVTVSRQSQIRYTCDGVVDTARRPRDILADMASAGAGVITCPGGMFRLLPGAYSTPTVTLTESDLRGPVRVNPRLARRDLFNAVRGTYVDPANFWQPSDYPQVANATYAENDGGEVIVRDNNLPFTTNSTRAQRLSKISLEKSRQGMTVELRCNLRQAFGLALWDTVMLTLTRTGFAAKVFRVAKWTLAADGLGVDLVLREESAASYDWAAGEATTIDPAPNTSLGDAFTVPAPGTPVAVESLIETTGSAGVKPRLSITWGASDSAFVSAYELQWKAINDATWYVFPWQESAAYQIEDVSPGSYNLRVRARTALGVRSAYSSEATVEVRGLATPPAAVTNLSVIASAGFALVSWTLTGDLDVRLGGRVVVRHASATSGAAWVDGMVLEEFAGAAVSGTVPLVTGTYMAKFVDSSGNYSASEATFVVTEGMVTGFTTVATITESTTFTGTKTDLTVATGTLRLSSGTLIDSVADWDAITDLDNLGAVAAAGTYLFNTVYDGTTVATRRYEADITVQSFDTGDSIDARGPIDDWGSFDGDVIDDCDVTLYAATTNDDPAGSPTWGAWTPFVVADFTARAAKFKVEFLSGAPTHNIKISTLKIDVKVP